MQYSFDYTKEPGRVRKNHVQASPEQALVTVITGFYNAGRYFEQTFNSVMNQTFPWFEWVIVNDGSTSQEDVELLCRLATTDRRVRIIHQENGGLSAARNAAVADARTDLIVPLDADDLIEPQYLQVLWFVMQRHPEAAWCYTDNVGFQEQQYLWKREFSAELMKRENILTYSAAIRKKDLEEVGCYIVEKQLYNEDWRTWLNLLSAHKKPVHLSGYLFWYRRLSSGMLSSLNKDPEKKAFCEAIIEQASKTVDTAVTAIEYPRPNSEAEFTPPWRMHAKQQLPKEEGKKRVLMLLPWLEMGGADQFNLDLIRTLPQEYEVSVITTLPDQNPWKQRFGDLTDEVYCLADFLDSCDYSAFISWYIESRQIDLLLVSNSYYGYYLLPWLRRQFPQLAIMDYVHMEEWYYRNGGYARTSAALQDIVEYTCVCNGKTQRVMIEQMGRADDTVETVYIGVDTRRYNPDVVEAGQAYQALGIDKKRPIVLFPCRMHPQKRPFLMLEIAKKLKKTKSSFAFAVVGDGPQLDEMKQFVKENKLEETVYFAGTQTDMRPWYKDAAVTLICSINEGLSLTAYESASMGVPIITSDVGGQAELVDSSIGRVVPMLQDQATQLDARSFPQEEVESYLAAFADLFSDASKYAATCAACRKRVLEGFSIELMGQRMAAIFDRLLTDPVIAAKREQKARLLDALPALTADYTALYLEYERQQSRVDETWKAKCWLEEKLGQAEQQCKDLEEVWKAKCWFEGQLEQYKEQAEKAQILQAELDRIHSMRSWRLINLYHRLRGRRN